VLVRDTGTAAVRLQLMDLGAVGDLAWLPAEVTEVKIVPPRTATVRQEGIEIFAQREWPCHSELLVGW